MKNLIFAVLVTFAGVQLSAQDISFSQHGNYNPNPFYADLVSKVSTLNGDWGLFGGLRAGYNVNENFSIGAAAHGLIPVSLSDSYINREGKDELHFGYGGAEAAYKYNLSEKFFLKGTMMIGAGRVDYENAGGNDYFFIAEPGASLNYRITNWFGLGYSLSYRLASGVKYSDFSNASFSGWSMDLGLSFGFNF